MQTCTHKHHRFLGYDLIQSVGFAAVMVAFVILVLGWSASPVHAQKKPRNIIRITEAVKIVGKIQKPQAFYVLHRAPLNYQGLQLKENFLKKVIQAVKKAPF